MAQSRLYRKYLISLLASASFLTSNLYFPEALANNAPPGMHRKPAMVEVDPSVLQALHHIEIAEARLMQHQAFVEQANRVAEQQRRSYARPQKSADVKEAEKLLIELRDPKKLPIEQSIPERVMLFSRQPVNLKPGQQFYQPVEMPVTQQLPLLPQQSSYQLPQSQPQTQPQVVYQYQPQVLSQSKVTAKSEENTGTVVLMSEIIKVLDKVDSTLATAGNNIASATDKTGKVLKENASKISSWIVPPRIVTEDSPVVDSDALISEWNNPDIQAVKEGKQRRITTIAAIGQEQEPMAGAGVEIAADKLPWKEKKNEPAPDMFAGIKKLFVAESAVSATAKKTESEKRSSVIDESWQIQEKKKIEEAAQERAIEIGNDQPTTAEVWGRKVFGAPQPQEETLDSADIDKPEPVAEEYSEIVYEDQQPIANQAKDVDELIRTAMPIVEKNTIVTIAQAKEEPTQEKITEKNKEVAEKSDLRIIEKAPKPVNKPQDMALKENRARKMREFSVVPVMKAPLAARPAAVVNVANNVPAKVEISQEKEIKPVVATLSDQKKEENTKEEVTALVKEPQQAVNNEESRPVTTAMEERSTIPSGKEEGEAMSITAAEREQKLLQVRDHMIKAIAELPPTPAAPDNTATQEKIVQPVIVKTEEKPMISLEQQERAKAIMGNLVAKTKEIIAEQKQGAAVEHTDNVIQSLGTEYQKQEEALKEKVSEIQDNNTPSTHLAPPPLPVEAKPEASLTPAPLPTLPLNDQKTAEEQVADIIKPVLEENDKAKEQSPVVVGNISPTNNQAFFSVMFKGDTTELSPEGKAKLQELISALSQGKGRLTVIGYATDASDTPRSARRISLERAVVVRNFLISSGLESKRISVQALGDIINKPDPTTQNRVDIFLTEDGSV